VSVAVLRVVWCGVVCERIRTSMMSSGADGNGKNSVRGDCDSSFQWSAEVSHVMSVSTHQAC